MRLFALTLLLFAYCSHAQEPKRVTSQPRVKERYTQEKTNQKQPKPSESAPSKIAIGSLTVGEPQTQPKQAEAYDASKDALYRWYLRATIIGVGGAIAGIIILILQTKATQQAVKAALLNANAAQENAEAAALNARALINAERAWVFVTIERTGEYNYRLELANHGRTPAEVTGVRYLEQYLEIGEELVGGADYGPPTDLVPHHMLFPGEQPWVYRHMSLRDAIIHSTPLLQDVIDGRQWQYIYGVVDYRNVLSGTEHYTRFCFRYSAPILEYMPTGLPEYTQYT